MCFATITTGWNKRPHSVNIYPYVVLGTGDTGQKLTHDLIWRFELGGQMQAQLNVGLS